MTSKEITPCGENLFSVTSEPGDYTKYSYFVFKDHDEFCFMPNKNTFRYPQRLNYYGVKNLTEEELFNLAEKENCNPHTLKECIRTIEFLSL